MSGFLSPFPRASTILHILNVFWLTFFDGFAGIGDFTDELTTWTRCDLLRIHAKCAVLGAPREMLTTIGPSINSMEFCKAVFIVLLAAATILLLNIMCELDFVNLIC